MIEQQTLYMAVKDITPFMDNKDDTETIVKTNWDELIDDVIIDIFENGGIQIQKTVFTSNNNIYCIINWIDKNKAIEQAKKEIPNIAMPDFGNSSQLVK